MCADPSPVQMPAPHPAGTQFTLPGSGGGGGWVGPPALTSLLGSLSHLFLFSSPPIISIHPSDSAPSHTHSLSGEGKGDQSVLPFLLCTVLSLPESKCIWLRHGILPFYLRHMEIIWFHSGNFSYLELWLCHHPRLAKVTPKHL